MSHSRLRRAAPLGALALAATAFAAPAQGAGGVPAPGGEIIFNTASVTLSTFPTGATPVSVVRDGVTIATATANVDGTGIANLNVNGIAAPEPLDCWTGFTPDILPGDSIVIGGAVGTTVAVPDFSVDRVNQIGGDLVFGGKAATLAGTPMVGVEGDLVTKVNRFSAGGKGGQILTGALSFDPGASTFTTRFAGLSPGDMAIGLNGASARVTTVPPAVHAAGAAMTIGADNPGTPGPVPGCGAPLGSDAVTGASTKTINAANVGSVFTITGTSDPNVKGVTLNVGGTTVPATLGGGTWSATVPAGNLPEGVLTAAATFAGAGGTFHGRTMSVIKDTVAPAAPAASVPAGTYASAQSVALASERGATIHFTTNGSDPTASSPTYGNALNVAGSQTVKAIAVDAAGNTSPVAEFGYAISPPVAAPAPAPKVVPSLARLKVDSLTLTRRSGLRSVRRRGIDAIVYAPEGAKVAKIRILKSHKVIQTINRKISRDGVLEVRLPTTKRTRKALKRGVYRVEFQVGQSTANLGAKMVRTVRIV